MSLLKRLLGAKDAYPRVLTTQDGMHVRQDRPIREGKLVTMPLTLVDYEASYFTGLSQDAMVKAGQMLARMLDNGFNTMRNIPDVRRDIEQGTTYRIAFFSSDGRVLIDRHYTIHDLHELVTI